MKTIREQIIERIITQLETITRENGYDNEIGLGNVYRQESVIEQNIVPALAVWELDEIRKRNQSGGTVRKLLIRVEAIVAVNNEKHPAAVGNQLLGDVEKALIMGDMSLDELIDDIQDIAATISRLPPDYMASKTDISYLPTNYKLAGATIDFEITYTTEWGDPYTMQ
ncbi:hypothetical protein QUF74_10255 [Candidatus Halobeggiatoa sp. HSG11]|nr:hypothetical protein [Candidatus Halobeggiatoa sp. HSG11]